MEWLKWDFSLHPHLFFGIDTIGFEPPNVDKKANAKKDEYIGKGKFQKRIAPLKSLEVPHLLFIRSATESEIVSELKIAVSAQTIQNYARHGKSNHAREKSFAQIRMG